MIDPVNPQDKVTVVAVMAEKKRYVGIYHSSRDVRTSANHFRNLLPLYQPELAKKESLTSLSNFKSFLGLVNFEFSLIFVGTFV